MAITVSIRNGMGDCSAGTGADEADFMHLSTDFMESAGVLRKSSNDAKVTEHSPANKSVDVAKGTVYVGNSSYAVNSATTKYWRVEVGSIQNATIDSNTSGNPRIDIVCLHVDTTASPDATASNVATIVVTKGTPAASPAVPATPSNSYKLAEVAVANGFSSITNSNITDKRVQPIFDDLYVSDIYNAHLKGSTEIDVSDAWHAMPYASGWTEYGLDQEPCRYRKLPDGRVEMKGLCKTTTAKATQSTILTLPTGYRPAGTMICHTRARQGGADESVRFDIKSDGTVVAFAAMASGAWFSFSTTTFTPT